MICKDIGPPDAKVMLIGEAPGEHEERTGIPFVGSSGKLLKQMLSHSGIRYQDCFVTNVIRYFYNSGMPSKALEDAIHVLRGKIESIHPQVVIPLGNEPLKAVCNKTPISAYRGTWLSYRGINVLPTYHPSYIMRVYQDHPIVELDLKKAVCNKPKPLPKPILSPSVEQVAKWIDKVIRLNKRVAFDLETVEKTIRCVGLAAKDEAPICIPFISFASSQMTSVGDSVVKIGSNRSSDLSNYWTANEEVEVVTLLNKMFRSVSIVGHNSVMFDAPLLHRNFKIVIKNHFMDTMNAWHCLYSELPNSLSFLTSVLTDYPNYWTGKDTADDISEWNYNSADAQVTLDVSFIIERELKETLL